ncbi:MAG: hypothetical protein KAI47_16525 [Deltaproteobacteria bacterium]|nr:hypothetical protein [Deltaproteobacteria bacterium]
MTGRHGGAPGSVQRACLLLGLGLSVGGVSIGGLLTCKAKPKPQPAPKAPLIGQWRLIKQVAIDQKPLSFQIKRKQYTFKAGGSFDLKAPYENYRDERWRRKGERLTFLRRPRKLSKDLAPYAPPPLVRRARIVKLTAARLILEEPQPKVYGGRMVRETFRRVSQAPFGPLLGAKTVQLPLKAGQYAAVYHFSLSKYPTQEIHITRTITGGARLTLGKDGAVSGCLAARVQRYASRSKYASPDRRQHVHRTDERHLVGIKGRWRPGDKAATIASNSTSRNTCSVDDKSPHHDPIELSCVAIRSNERLPVVTLACRLIKGCPWLREIAINPADTFRAGPYTMQNPPMNHFVVKRGEPWLLLGASPGLAIRSHDQRQARAPDVRFEAKQVSFVERDFRSRVAPTPKKRTP